MPAYAYIEVGKYKKTKRTKGIFGNLINRQLLQMISEGVIAGIVWNEEIRGRLRDDFFSGNIYYNDHGQTQ